MSRTQLKKKRRLERKTARAGRVIKVNHVLIPLEEDWEEEVYRGSTQLKQAEYFNLLRSVL
jgi:hypothetical protein